MEQLKSMKEMLVGCVQGQLTHLDTVDAQELGAAVDMIKDLSEAIYYCTVTEAMEEKEEKGEKGGGMMYYPVMYYRESNTTDGRDNPRGGREGGGGGRRNYEDYDMRYYEDMRYHGGMMPYPYYPQEDYYRDMDKMKGRMYYNGGSSGGGNSGGSSGSSGNSGSSGGSSSGNSGSRNYSERQMQFGEMMRDQREGRSGQSRKMYMESKEMHKDKASQLQELEKYAQELTSDMVEMIKDASPEEKQYLSNRIAALATKIK